MEFRLTYQGPLKANAGLSDKQALRRSFHTQLALLWSQIPLTDIKTVLKETPDPFGISILKPVGEFTFAPLICESLSLIADLQITMLRPEAPGRIITQSGDIDNRLKTLFDSLRMPLNPTEIPAGDNPGDNEKPFYCLLEDDNLITKVSVITDRWLDSRANSNDVFLIICVTTTTIQKTLGNIGL